MELIDSNTLSALTPVIVAGRGSARCHRGLNGAAVHGHAPRRAARLYRCRRLTRSGARAPQTTCCLTDAHRQAGRHEQRRWSTPGDTSYTQMFTDVGVCYAADAVLRGGEFDGAEARGGQAGAVPGGEPRLPGACSARCWTWTRRRLGACSTVRRVPLRALSAQVQGGGRWAPS